MESSKVTSPSLNLWSDTETTTTYTIGPTNPQGWGWIFGLFVPAFVAPLLVTIIVVDNIKEDGG